MAKDSRQARTLNFNATPSLPFAKGLGNSTVHYHHLITPAAHRKHQTILFDSILYVLYCIECFRNTTTMLDDILASLDIEGVSARIYLFLLHNGPTSASGIARGIGVPRSSLYGMLERLGGRGLVAQFLRRDVKLFSAEPPEKINLLFQEKIASLEKQQSEYRTLIQTLRTDAHTLSLQPRFQLFEGQDGLQHVLRDMLLYSDIETQSFWPIRTMIDTLSPDFFRAFNRERVKNRLYTRALWPEAQQIDTKKYPYLGSGMDFYREIRIAPQDIDCSMGYWIYGSKVAFLSSSRESFGFIIESHELTRTLLTQFEVVWNLSKPIATSRIDTGTFE